MWPVLLVAQRRLCYEQIAFLNLIPSLSVEELSNILTPLVLNSSLATVRPLWTKFWVLTNILM